MPALNNGKEGFPKILRWALWWCVVTVMLGGFVYLFLYMFERQSEIVIHAVEDRSPLFVFHSMTTSILVAAIGLIIAFAYVILENLARVVAHGAVHRFLERSRVVCAYCFFASLVLMLFGAPLFNIFWNGYFEDNGYVQCSGGVLQASSEMFNSVWSQEPQWCRDEKVIDILREVGYGTSGVGQANEYLSEITGDTAANSASD